ncbi:hypothetical protein DPMN_077781, partial [Dreissena polymorpha]
SLFLSPHKTSVNMKKAPPPVLKRKNAPPPGAHVLEKTDTIIELAQDIIGTNLLTMFHVWAINVASRLFTMQMLTPHNTHRTTDKMRSQKAHLEHIVAKR